MVQQAPAALQGQRILQVPVLLHEIFPVSRIFQVRANQQAVLILRPRNDLYIQGPAQPQHRAGLHIPVRIPIHPAVPTGLLPRKTGPQLIAGRLQLRPAVQPAAHQATAGQAAHRVTTVRAVLQAHIVQAAAPLLPIAVRAVLQAPIAQEAVHAHPVVHPPQEDPDHPLPVVEEGKCNLTGSINCQEVNILNKQQL